MNILIIIEDKVIELEIIKEEMSIKDVTSIDVVVCLVRIRQR